MKKKGIIIGLIILLSSLTAIILVLTLRNKKTRLVLDSLDKSVTLDLGKYKVKDYNKWTEDGANYMISFYVTNKNDFYNDVIVKSKYYEEELDFDVKYYNIDNRYYAYGYFLINNRLFNYYIDEESKYVKISSRSGVFSTDNNYYLIPFPVRYSLSAEAIENETQFYYYRGLSDKSTTYEMVLKIAEHLPSTYTKIEDDCINIKGFSIDDNYIETLSDGYLIKIYEDENGKVKVGNVD